MAVLVLKPATVFNQGLLLKEHRTQNFWWREAVLVLKPTKVLNQGLLLKEDRTQVFL